MSIWWSLSYLPVLAAACVWVAACTGSDEPQLPRANLGEGDYRITITADYKGAVTVSELLFDSPASWYYTDPAFGEYIRIKDRDWQRVDGVWVVTGADSYLQHFLDFSLQGLTSMPPEGSRREEGPDRNGEPTSRWIKTSETYGETLAAAMEKSAERDAEGRDVILEQAREIRPATAVYEVILGDRSGRLYESRIVVSYGGRSSPQTFVVSYEPTTIYAPY